MKKKISLVIIGILLLTVILIGAQCPTAPPAGTPTATSTPIPTATTSATSSTISRVVIIPTSKSLVTGEEATFSAYAVDSSGNRVSATISWSVSKGTLSSYSSTTTPTSYATVTYTAPTTITSSSGEDTVTLTATVYSNVSVSADATITVSYGSVDSITVSPSTATLSQGGTQTFTAYAKNSAGTQIPATITWTATGGTVFPLTSSATATEGATTTYTAPSTDGTYTVTASSGGKSGTAIVTVGTGSSSSASPTPTPTYISIDGTTNGNYITLDGKKYLSGTTWHLALTKPATSYDKMNVYEEGAYTDNSWEDFTQFKDYTLGSQTDGEKKIYVKYKNSSTGAVSSEYYDTGYLDTTGPKPISASATSVTRGDTAKQVTITFYDLTGYTNKYEINATNIDTVLALDNSHSWTVDVDGDGNPDIVSATWSTTGTTLVVKAYSTATVDIDDTITVGNDIADPLGNTASGAVSIEGSW